MATAPPERRVRRTPADEPVALGSHLRTWLVAGGGLLVLHGLASDAAWLETSWVDGWGVSLSRGLAWLSSAVPFSLAEPLVVVLVVGLLLRVLSAWSDVAARRRRLSNLLAVHALTVVDLTLVIGLVFTAVWGLSYRRAPAAERLGLAAPTQQLVELRAQAERVVDGLNAAYLDLHGSAEADGLTTPRSPKHVHAALERGFAASGAAWSLPESYQAARPPAKVPFGSFVLSYLGIGGIYVPFTGEATVNGDPPAWSLVMTAAHEKAHQRMVASEDEATFFGFLAGMHADEPMLRYAALQTAFSYAAGTLRRQDPEGFRALYERLSPGVRADREARSRHWKAYDGPLERVGERVNDTYLRAHGVQGGVQAYGRAAALIVAWLDTPEGRRLVPVQAPPALRATSGQGSPADRQP